MNKKKGIIIGVVVAVIAVIAIVIAVSGGKSSDDVDLNVTVAPEIENLTVPYDNNDDTKCSSKVVTDVATGEIAIDGKIYTIGKTTMGELLDDGFTTDTNTDAILENDKFISDVVLTKHGHSINCEFANRQGSDIKVSEAVLGAISFYMTTYDGIDMENDDVNKTMSIISGITLESSVDELIAYLDENNIKYEKHEDSDEGTELETITFKAGGIDYGFNSMVSVSDDFTAIDHSISITKTDLFIK